MRSVELLNKRTRERVVACEAVGLHYWADHPQDGCVWATDDEQDFHVVRIRRPSQTAQHACPNCAESSANYTIPV